MLISFVKWLIHRHSMPLGKGGGRGQKIKPIKKSSAQGETRTINYMGEDRLRKILFNYILGQYGEEMYKDFISVIKRCEDTQFYIEQKRGEGAFYTYTNGYPGCNEWIHCCYYRCYFNVEAVCGNKEIRVTIFDHNQSPHRNSIYTYYDEKFIPKPSKTEIRGDMAQEKGVDEIKPFVDGNTTYDGIRCDRFVCYDIAK